MELKEIIDSIRVRDRTGLWELLSPGISMCSTIPRGTARVNPLVRAIEANYLDADEEYELPDTVQALLWAPCDPNNYEHQRHRHWGGYQVM